MAVTAVIGPKQRIENFNMLNPMMLRRNIVRRSIMVITDNAIDIMNTEDGANPSLRNNHERGRFMSMVIPTISWRP